MKLKKIASLMLAGIMAVSMLTACGEGNPAPENPGEGENNNTASGYSAMLGEKAADTLNKADNADLFTFADNADDQKALNKVVATLNQDTILEFVTNYTTDNFGEAAANSIRSGVQADFEEEAGMVRPLAQGWYTDEDINTTKIGDVWVANGNISMDNVMSTIFEAYKNGFKNEDGKGTWSGENVELSYDFDVAVSVVNVPLSAYNEYTGSVNFIAVTVTRTADYV